MRRELIHSPFTQTDLCTPEDAVRARSARQQTRLTGALATNAMRINDAELAAALDAGRRLTIARVSDAHTSHGLVAATLLDPDRNCGAAAALRRWTGEENDPAGARVTHVAWPEHVEAAGFERELTPHRGR